MSDPLTCLSCEHWRCAGCSENMHGFPNMLLKYCSKGCYDPGVDERDMEELAE